MSERLVAVKTREPKTKDERISLLLRLTKSQEFLTSYANCLASNPQEKSKRIVHAIHSRTLPFLQFEILRQANPLQEEFSTRKSEELIYPGVENDFTRETFEERLSQIAVDVFGEYAVFAYRSHNNEVVQQRENDPVGSKNSK